VRWKWSRAGSNRQPQRCKSNFALDSSRKMSRKARGALRIGYGAGGRLDTRRLGDPTNALLAIGWIQPRALDSDPRSIVPAAHDRRPRHGPSGARCGQCVHGIGSLCFPKCAKPDIRCSRKRSRDEANLKAVVEEVLCHVPPLEVAQILREALRPTHSTGT
jgi:hypothetical protein